MFWEIVAHRIAVHRSVSPHSNIIRLPPWLSTDLLKGSSRFKHRFRQCSGSGGSLGGWDEVLNHAKFAAIVGIGPNFAYGNKAPPSLHRAVERSDASRWLGRASKSPVRVVPPHTRRRLC